ncbi:FHA domain containing protein [Entamoeba marina]
MDSISLYSRFFKKDERSKAGNKKELLDKSNSSKLFNDSYSSQEGLRRCDCYGHLKRLSDQKGSNAPKLIHFFKRKTMIGRSSKCDVRFDSLDYPMTISRIHASFEMLDTGITVKDLSTNGVFVNNEKISMKILRDGDIVIFGGGSGIEVGSIVEQQQSPFIFQYVIVKKFEKPVPSIGYDEESVKTSTSECYLDTVSEDIGKGEVETNELRKSLSCPVCKNLIVIPTAYECGHSVCLTCDLEYSNNFGLNHACPVCCKEIGAKSKPFMIENLVKNLLESLSDVERAMYIERYESAEMYLMETEKVYGEVIVSKLPKEIREWTESEKDEVKVLFKKAKGKEREYWATTLGFSKAELMRMKEKEIEMMLENLRISYEKEENQKIKTARLFLFINEMENMNVEKVLNKNSN